MNLCLYLHLDLFYSSMNFVLIFVSNFWFCVYFLRFFSRATCQLLLFNYELFFSQNLISTPFGLLSSFWITFLLSKPFGLGDTAYIPPFEYFYGSLTINYSRQRWKTFLWSSIKRGEPSALFFSLALSTQRIWQFLIDKDKDKDKIDKYKNKYKDQIIFPNNIWDESIFPFWTHGSWRPA